MTHYISSLPPLPCAFAILSLSKGGLRLEDILFLNTEARSLKPMACSMK